MRMWRQASCTGLCPSSVSAATEAERLIDLADNSSDVPGGAIPDEAAFVYAETDGERHNTITPIARMQDGDSYELDLALRNNITTEEHPLGVYHPHAGAASHQKGKHRPHRGDGSGGTAIPLKGQRCSSWRTAS